MILLSGHSLTPARKVPLEALSLQLKERESTASMTPADMSGISVNSWLQDDTNPGKGIVWRVKSISQAFATSTTTVSLEHAIATLKDTIMFGEHKAAQITGNSRATTCTALQAVRYILSKQSDWTLGSFGYNVSNPYKFNGESLFDALEIVTNSLDNAVWTYDMSRYPFRLNITQKNTAVDSELRAGRNLRTITKSIDRSGMFTRLYPIGANDLHLGGGGYVEKNTSSYGIVSKTETESSIDSAAELQRWANERLKNHCEPTVSIEIEGLELADATGETMDRLALGRVCRVPLPEFGTTIQETITAMSYPDKVHNPETVKITLANNKNDITRIVSDAIKKSGRSGRTAAKKDKEDNAWFEDTNEHVAMCAKGIVGVDAQGNPNWTRLSQIYVDGSGIVSTVETTQAGLSEAVSKIEQNEKEIKAEVKRAKKEEGELTGKISVQAGKVSLVVEEKNGQNVIKTASIVTSINNSGSSIRLSADKVYIGDEKSTTVIAGKCVLNDVTADYINNKVATIANLTGLAATFNGNVKSMGSVYGAGLYIGTSAPYKNVSSAVDYLTLASAGTDKWSLTETYLDGTSRVVGTFDHAAPTILAGTWDGNKYTVEASPQGNKESAIVYVHPVASQGAAYTDIYVATTDGSNWTNHGDATRLTMVPTVWGAGQRVDLKDGNNIVYAQLQVADPTVTTETSWNDRTFTVTAKTRGADRSSKSTTLYVHPTTSQGGAYTDVYVAEQNGSSWVNHGPATRLTMTEATTTWPRRIDLRDGSNATYAQLSIAAPVPTIEITCVDQGNPSRDANPKPITATAYVKNASNRDVEIGASVKNIVMTTGSWSGGRRAINCRLGSTSGPLITRIWINDEHTNKMTIRQTYGYASARNMRLYYTDNTVSDIPSGFHLAGGGAHYWYYSAKDLNQTGQDKTVYY